MPITLSILFTTPQDVWDLLSVEGVDLRNDDSNLASGQVITASADAAVGATSISLASLPVALLRGAELTFLQAGMEVPSVARLTAAATASSFATTLSVEALTVAVNSGAQARDSGVNAATGVRLAVACRKGTSEVKLWCNSRYDDSQLLLSGSVCDWATTCAARWLCTRRSQACPKGLKADYDETLRRMELVQGGNLQIEDIGTRGVDWPSMTNVTVNPAYDGMRARSQWAISEQTPTAYNQFLDWNSALTFAY